MRCLQINIGLEDNLISNKKFKYIGICCCTVKYIGNQSNDEAVTDNVRGQLSHTAQRTIA